MTDTPSPDLIRAISRHSLSYVLDSISELFRHYAFDPLDLLIIHAIMNINVGHVMKTPELDRQFGSVETIEPDAIKVGVSRAGLSRFLNLPIETIRRRVNRLKKEGVIRELDHGLIITEENVHRFGDNHELQKTNVILVRKLLRDLARAGVDLGKGI